MQYNFNNNIFYMKDVKENLNDFTYLDYFYKFMLLARSVFKWENLPNGIKEEWIEKYLFSEGRCMFFKDSKLGFMITCVTDGGEVNAYDEPTKLIPNAINYDVNGKQYNNTVDAVLIKNNDICMPTAYSIRLYALRIAELTRAIDVNVNAQKTPIIIKGNDKQIMSLKRAYDKYEGNTPVLFIDKALDGDILKAINTSAPVVFDKLQIQKHEIINECMTFLGLNNANTQKRERLITDEVEANNEQIQMHAQLMLKAREQAAEEINKLFNLDIKVSLRSEVVNFSEPSQNPLNLTKGGEVA